MPDRPEETDPPPSQAPIAADGVVPSPMTVAEPIDADGPIDDSDNERTAILPPDGGHTRIEPPAAETTAPPPEANPDAPTHEDVPMTSAVPPVYVATRMGSANDPRSGAYWDTVDSGGEFQPGQVVFGRYVVREKIGRGGMGAVWLVTHRELNVDRALKLIVAGISYDAQARARFRREAQLMARFVHPNAVIVHDARLTENDVAYIDMEYIKGLPVDRVIRKGEPMPLDWVARVLDQLCGVLQVAHDRGIVHRDLKPANMMIADDGPGGVEHVKVLDFGIAKILGDADTHGPQTMTGAFMGTPPYASPEQGDGKSDTRSDLYSVGVILFEFLTGFRPFNGPAPRVLVDTITKEPPRFAEVNPSVSYPPGVEALVRKCLAKDPDNRPQSAREIASAFREALPSRPIADLPPGAPPPSAVLPWLRIAGAVAATGLMGYFASKEMGKTDSAKGAGAIGSASGGSMVRPLVPPGFAAMAEAKLDANGRPSALSPSGEGQALGITLIALPGGSFVMGRGSYAHDEAVVPFAIGETEVTNGQMRAYFRARAVEPPIEFTQAVAKLTRNPETPLSPEEADLHPAVGIPAAMAREFARWLHADLPTEAQWEYVARSAGTFSRPYVWPDPNPLKANSGRSNIDTDTQVPTRTTKPGSYRDDRTDQGIVDLAGNVREWCLDGKAAEPKFVVRGASWHSLASDFPDTTWKRSFESPTESLDDLGFRIAVEWPAKPNP